MIFILVEPVCSLKTKTTNIQIGVQWEIVAESLLLINNLVIVGHISLAIKAPLIFSIIKKVMTTLSFAPCSLVVSHYLKK